MPELRDVIAKLLAWRTENRELIEPAARRVDAQRGGGREDPRRDSPIPPALERAVERTARPVAALEGHVPIVAHATSVSGRAG
jgi:hypothetical protein